MKKNNSKLKFLSYLLVSSLALSSCGTRDYSINNSTEVIDEIVNDTDEESELQGINIIETESELDKINIIDLLEYSSEPVILDGVSLEYYKFFDNLIYNYNYQELYPSINGLIYDTNCKYVFDGNIDGIVDSIVNNSNSINEEGYTSLFENGNEALLTSILTKIVENSTNDINEDMHKLSGLSIVYGPLDWNISGQYDQEKNMIILNNNMIDFLVSEYNVTRATAIKYILFHEINHLRQTKCDCRLVYGDVDLYSFIFEAAAESEIYQKNFIDFPICTYDYYRDIESKILLLSLFTQNDINGYYDSIDNSDFGSLVNYLGLDGEEISEFNNILYNINAIDGRNNLLNSLGYDFELTTLETAFNVVGNNYVLSLYKMLIKRLINYTVTNDISLEENIVLYDLIKNELVKDLYIYVDNGISVDKVYDEFVVNTLIELDNIYKEYLVNKYSTDLEDIEWIEYINSRLITGCIYEYVNNKEITNEYYVPIAIEYLNKYPLLNNILLKTNYNYNNYSNAVYDVLKKK